MTQRNEERDAAVQIANLKESLKKPRASVSFEDMEINTNPFPVEERLDVAQYDEDLASIKEFFDTESLFELALAAVKVFEAAQRQKRPSAKVRRALEHPLTKTAVTTLKTALPQYGTLAEVGLNLVKETLPESPSDEKVAELEEEFTAAWQRALSGKDVPEA